MSSTNEYKQNFQKYFMPMLFQFIITGIMNSADKLIAALFIGTKALVATSLSSPLLLIFMAVGGMFTSGVGSYLGLMKGRGSVDKANSTVTFVFIVMALISIIMSIFIFIYSGWFASFLGAKQEYFELTEIYIHYIAFFIVFMVLAGVIQSCIMNDESPKYVAFTKTAMTVCNVSFNLLFVVVFKMGVKGLGLATVLSSFIALALSLYYMLFKSRSIHFAKPIADWKAFFKMNYNGLSSFLSLASLSVSIFTINYSLTHFLPYYYFEGYSLAVMFTIFIRHPYMAGSMGIQPIISKEFGANNYVAVKGYIRHSLFYALRYAVIVYLVIIPIVYLCVPFFSQDKNVIHAAYRIYLGLGFSFMFMTVTLQMPSFYTAMGRPLESLAFSVIRSLILVPSLVYCCVLLFKVDGLGIAYVLADTFLSIVILFYMKKKDISTLKSVV